MAEKDNDIFSDEFPENKAEPSEFTEIPDLGEPPKKPDDIKDNSVTKPSKRREALVGLIVISVIIGLSYYGITEFLDDEPFNSSECDYGVAQDLFGTRCMTLAEYDLAIGLDTDDKTPPPPTQTPTPTPEVDETPFKDVSSTSDKVEVDKSKDPIGYFMVTTNDDWYGDFVDIRKIPSKIEKSGSMKINFRCYTDEFQGTSIYFGTFRNVVDADLTVEVFINGKKVESQSTTTNKALIIEGSCY